MNNEMMEKGVARLLEIAARVKNPALADSIRGAVMDIERGKQRYDDVIADLESQLEALNVNIYIGGNEI